MESAWTGDSLPDYGDILFKHILSVIAKPDVLLSRLEELCFIKH